MSVMALAVLFFYANVSSLNSIIPTLGALALGGQKLLPVLQQGYSAWSSLRGGQALLEDVVYFLETEYKLISHSAEEEIKFSQKIEILNVNFRHKGSSFKILENLNLTIPKGSTVGFIGETGRGKTTLLDIIMGLLEPSSGQVLIDNKALTKNNMRSWQKKISHVPQNIFLSDDSIKNNIAFGVPNEEVDESRVKRALEKSYLVEYVNSLPDKSETFVGERGARLSGGQKQRLGIARALYKNIELVIFDEATSSLDSSTEEKVMDEIASLDDNLTLLIIAHRVTTLKTCDFIVNLKSSGMEILKYEDIQKLKND
jgi:ATP-binding cassette subfamily B protein